MRRLILLMIALLLLGCVGKPEIKKITYKWGEVNESTTEILVNVDVFNPNPFPIPLKDVVLNIYMNGIEMGKGHAIKAEIPANSESNIVIAVYLDNDKIPEWWVSHIKNGETTKVDIKGDLIFDLKLFQFKYPIEFTNTIRTNILSIESRPEKISIDGVELDVRSVESHWGKVNEKETEIITVADVFNPNPFPIPVISFDYVIRMNGIIVGRGSEDVNTVISPNSDAKLTLITKIENYKLKEWWVSHIRNGEKTIVDVEIMPKIKLFGKEIKFKLLERKFEIRTRFLG